MSFDLQAGRGSVVTVGAGGGRQGIALPRSRSWRRVELVRQAGRLVVAVAGRRIGSLRASGRVHVRARHGEARIANIVATGNTRAALLLHRLAALRLRAPAGRIPIGEGTDGRLRFRPAWMRGFWAGALWQAYDSSGRSRLFRRWAVRASLDTRGLEGVKVHDLGFIYGHSTVAAQRRLCRPPAAGRAALCASLRASGLRAAATLLALAGTNAKAGTLPTQAVGCGRRCASPGEADTLIDSMMNLDLLLWAGRETGDPAYREAARRHAHAVAALLVRPDGSTVQSAHFDRATGALLGYHTHQGLSVSSTWSRGQAWAIYGFAQSAATLSDEQLGRVAERTAGYFERALGAATLPRWDFDAGFGPTDSSAAAIAAAGLDRLVAWRCAQGDASCRGARRWRRLAGRLRRGALAAVRQLPPLGRFSGQVYTYGGKRWDENAEFLMGIDYLLEASRATNDPPRP